VNTGRGRRWFNPSEANKAQPRCANTSDQIAGNFMSPRTLLILRNSHTNVFGRRYSAVGRLRGFTICIGQETAGSNNHATCLHLTFSALYRQPTHLTLTGQFVLTFSEASSMYRYVQVLISMRAGPEYITPPKPPLSPILPPSSHYQTLPPLLRVYAKRTPCPQRSRNERI
jgi:hypothetical protein